MILGGDYNSVLDVFLDRSFPPLPGAPTTAAMKALHIWAAQWHLVDAWRHRNSHDRVSSFYSGAHDLHVRLDRIMVSDDLLPVVVEPQYLRRTHSDHNPHTLQIDWNSGTPPIPRWRLQPDTLLDEMFREALGTTIAQYFEDNAGTASSPLVEWDTFKIVTWEHCLGMQAGMRRQLEKDLTALERKLASHESRATEGSHRQLTHRGEEHSKLLERLKCLNYVAHSARTHHSGDKAGRLSAWLILQDDYTSPVTSLRSAQGIVIYSQQAIHREFASHYTTLYKSHILATTDDIHRYLVAVTLPQITPEQRIELNEPILLEEIRARICSLASGKTHGPDGRIL